MYIYGYMSGAGYGGRYGRRKMCCCGKKKERTDSEKKLLLNRLKRIEGQIRGIYGMVENDAYCIDILNQAQAANASIDSI